MPVIFGMQILPILQLFGNCAELSLDVSKGNQISVVLVCRPKDLFAAIQYGTA